MSKEREGGDITLRRKLAILSSLGIVSILLVSLFYYNMVKAQDVGEYDPWIDYNDDGVIDGEDFFYLLRAWGTSGTPINKTALLLELIDRVDSLNASLLNLEAYLETRITELNCSLVDLQNQMLPQGFMRAPAYDSGWVSIDQGQTLTLTHNLNTTDVFVYMMGKGTTSGINHNQYGGYENYLAQVGGAKWMNLENTTIKVSRNAHDGNWMNIRIMIWIIQKPPA